MVQMRATCVKKNISLLYFQLPLYPVSHFSPATQHSRLLAAPFILRSHQLHTTTTTPTMAPKKAAPATTLSERSTRPRRGAAPAPGTLNVTALQRSHVAAATDDAPASAASLRTEATYNVNMLRSLASDMSGVYPLRHCTGKNFLDLPGEIRNFIYELAAVRTKPVKLLHGTPSYNTRP
jgi:hypothetical protein